MFHTVNSKIYSMHLLKHAILCSGGEKKKKEYSWDDLIFHKLDLLSQLINWQMEEIACSLRLYNLSTKL